jgi:hypothetical protein
MAFARRRAAPIAGLAGKAREKALSLDCRVIRFVQAIVNILFTRLTFLAMEGFF